MVDIKKQFENLKNELEELKIRKISDQRQKQKINEQMKQICVEIKESFGVQVQVFESVIEDLQKQLLQKKQSLKKKIIQAKEKIK